MGPAKGVLIPRQESAPRRWEYRPRNRCRNAATYWLRYVLTEPREAAEAIPGRIACRLFRRHNATCRGRLDHTREKRP